MDAAGAVEQTHRAVGMSSVLCSALSSASALLFLSLRSQAPSRCHLGGIRGIWVGREGSAKGGGRGVSRAVIGRADKEAD